MSIIGGGTIEKRGKNLYRIRFNSGADPITGTYTRTPWRTVRGTKADAQTALAEYRKEIESGINLDADKMPFGEFADLFCEQREAQGTLAPNTLKDTGYTVRTIKTYLDNTPIKSINAPTINKLLAQLGKDGKSPAGIKRVFQVLSQIMREAVLQDVIAANPCDKVRAPKKPKPKIEFLSADEIAQLLAALDETEQEAESIGQEHRATAPRREHRFKKCEVREAHRRAQIMAVHIGLATGARRGEVLGLIWGYLDLQAQTMRIAQQMTKDGIRQPKTERGQRVVSLGADIVERLIIWKERQATFLKTLGIAQSADTPVITNEIGGFCDVDGFSHWWRKFCKSNGFDNLRFHELRHTQATLLISQGVDIKTVQNRLGHTLASTTLDLYAGVMPAKDREAADLINNIMAKK